MTTINKLLDTIYESARENDHMMKTLDIYISDVTELYVNNLQRNDRHELVNTLRPIDSEDTRILTKSLLKKSNLKALDLSFNDIKDNGLLYLSEYIHETETLEDLDLVNNQITTVGMVYLAKGLKANCSLRMLVLSRNDIADDGVLLLVNALQDKAIETLGLDATGITIAGMIHISKFVSKSNNIKDEGAGYLAQSLLVNKSLRTIVLEENIIGDDGALELANAIQQNTTLSELVLCDNNIGQKGAAALASALTSNATIHIGQIRNPEYTYDDLEAIESHILQNITRKSEDNLKNQRKRTEIVKDLILLSRSLIMMDQFPPEIVNLILQSYAHHFEKKDWKIVSKVLLNINLIGKIHDDHPFTAASLVRLSHRAYTSL
ncbi:hypothetical protein HK103_004464 [Boothiomyces macroporosus]|uniref:Uncharacterized protein n=1 Tax=Boothiomyces macroporosus TaxID=261099 RepID=A0AAD5UJE0_9FUNG|nr:hypothetical protein HK103_004464 [Boothiomyces macroporosus]